MKRSAAVLIVLAVAGCTPTAGRNPGLPPDPHRVLLEALRSGQPPLESYAAEAYLGLDAAPPRAELEALVSSGNPRVRTTALAVLAATRRPDLQPLFRRARTDGDPVVRLAAAFGLAMTGDPSEVTLLRDALSSPDVAQRRTAAWLLGLMGNPTAVGMLKVKLQDPDAMVVLRAAEALKRLGSDYGAEQLRRLLEHERHEVRYVAARLLGQAGAQEDVPRLERLARSQVFLDVKFAAIASLARLGDLKRINVLIEMLDTPDPDVQTRVLAARELGETGYRPALEPLGRLLGREVLLERVTAAAAILRIESAGGSWRTRALADEAKEAAEGAP